uniref:Citrate transport protein n=1 Tax=Timema shepardi TaxID=629360 RepID=A0A7R9AY21_TIMSH|nr:unnamed protein product [Timema shepardi]
MIRAYNILTTAGRDSSPDITVTGNPVKHESDAFDHATNDAAMNERFQNPFRRPWMVNNGAASEIDYQHNKSKGLRLRVILASGIAGGIDAVITYPTDYVKTQLQLDGQKGAAKQYSGVVDCITKTVRWYGLSGLYRGIKIVLYGAIPKSVVILTSFDCFKSLLADDRGHLTPGYRFLSGLAAGVFEAFIIVTPLENIKVKFINDHRLVQPRYRSFLHGIKLIVKEYGILGLYKGVSATIVKHRQQSIHQTGKEWYKGDVSSANVPSSVVGLIGAFAGAASVLANTPADVVKTRMQGLDSHKYKNTADCVVKMFKEGGIATFYKGTLPRLVKVCMDVSITFVIYDAVLDVFGFVWPEE